MTIGFTQQDLIGLQNRVQGSQRQTIAAPDRLLDLRDIFGILRRRLRIIAASVALALALGIAYILLVPQNYSATSVILIDPRQTRVISSEDVLSGIGSDRAAVESQVELIESSALAERIVDQLNLTEDPEFTSSMARRWLVGVFGSEARATIEKNKVVEKFRENLNVKRRGLTYVLEIRFTSRDAAKAALIANAVTNTYLREQLGAKQDATTDASDWLENRIEALQEAVRESDQKVADFKAKHNIVEFVGGGSGSDLTQRQIDELNQQLTLARANTAETKAKYDRFQQFSATSSDPGSLSDALNSQVIADLRVQYAELSSTEAEYALTYGSRHPLLQTVRSQLAQIRAQIAQEIGRIQISARNDYEIALSRERSLDASLKQLKQEKADANKWNVELQALEREAKANQRLLEQFLERLKETTAQTSLQKADARVVSEAPVPVQSNGPGALIILLLAAAGGLGLGAAGAVLTETLDASFRTRSDLEAATSLPCLGLCPAIDPRQVMAAARERARAQGQGRFLRRGKLAQDAADALSRYSVLRPSTQFAESVRAALWGLRSTREVAGTTVPKVAMISSTVQNEGKSTLAANIAFCAAASGGLTLLIDADSRAGSLTDLFAPDATVGLSDVLQGAVTLEEAVTLDSETGLYMLPLSQKERRLRRADLLGDQNLRAFLDRHRDIFDLIVIDTPPIMPVPETRSLFDLADRALLVVEWGHTAQESVVAALNSVRANRHKIAGTLFNKVDTDSYRFYEQDYS